MLIMGEPVIIGLLHTTTGVISCACELCLTGGAVATNFQGAQVAAYPRQAPKRTWPIQQKESTHCGTAQMRRIYECDFQGSQAQEYTVGKVGEVPPNKEGPK